MKHPKTYIDSGYSFNLGYAFPTALGAKVAKPDCPVICVSGDGGFMFNASELSTAVKYGINTTTIVFRNDSYGNVARDLDETFAGTYETALHNPDFVKFAESFGATGMRADHPMDLERLIPLALERQAPVVIDVLRRYADTTRPSDPSGECAVLGNAPGRPNRIVMTGFRNLVDDYRQVYALQHCREPVCRSHYNNHRN